MKKLFTFKKMSVKFAFIIAAMVILIGGIACAYMQTRIIDEIDGNSRLYVRLRLAESVDKVDVALAEGRDIDQVKGIVSQVRLYDSGFAIMSDDHGEFFATNDFVAALNSGERTNLQNLAAANPGAAFDVTLNGRDFTAAHMALYNDNSLFLLAPRNEVMADVNASLVRFAIIFVAMVILIIIVSYFIGKSLASPLVVLNRVMKRAGDTGDISIGDEDMKLLTALMVQEDEIGQCVNSAVSIFKHVGNISEELEELSGGDLTVELDIVSADDALGLSLNHMVDNLNSIFGGIQGSTHQVSAGAKQIADGAQSLAQGSTEQAASIQELSKSIAEIADKTKVNAEMAGKTASLADTIKGNAEKGSRQMDEMISAVSDINQASQSIRKVIKVIDDIAFQTNILALNAAVEAARAGQHGKGFAVVAEEVRNLASKSAEAAKNTGELIANSMEKAELGTRIAGETADSLTEIVSGVNESSQFIAEIAKASEEQSLGITQINTGIDQVALVIQQNSATAQESAAASQEMSSQSSVLEDMVAQFKLKNAGMMAPILPPLRSM